MTDRGMGTEQVIITAPFIGVNSGSGYRELMYMSRKRLAVGMMHDTQTDISAVSSNGAHNQGAVIVIGAMSLLLVGSLPGRIVRMGMGGTFFPPRSETSRRFRSQHLPKPLLVESHGHGLESLDGGKERLAG